MKLVLLVYKKESDLDLLRDLIPDEYSILEAELGLKSLQLIKTIICGVVVVCASGREVETWVEDAHRSRPDLTFIGTAGAVNEDVHQPPGFYDYLHTPFTSAAVKRLLGRAWERSQLRFELASLRAARPDEKKAAPPDQYISRRPKEYLLSEFSRILSNNFDCERLLQFFLNVVNEMVSVSSISFLLRHQGNSGYKIFAQRGLDPQFCACLNFKPAQGLVAWLTENRRILNMETSDDLNALLPVEVLQEAQLLKAVVIIPLIVSGQLVGTVNLGPKVTGARFQEEELEILYIMSGNVAIALRDIELHQQLLCQQTYTENILQRMSSGVVAINHKHHIIAFNYRAGEILNLAPEEMTGKDLRALPSPLGDLLYETLTEARALHKMEIILPRGKIPLEVSTSPLIHEKQRFRGSVMIFDDISQRKQLELERRQADQLDILNKFVGQLAHEAKNPMVAIQTFSDLLPERYGDAAFRDFFNQTVRQEVKRLNEMVEQLIAFSTTPSYHFILTGMDKILDKCLVLLREQGKGQDTSFNITHVDKPLQIKADRILLPRAISYLLNNPFQALERGGNLYLHAAYDKTLFEQGGICLSIWDAVTRIEKKELPNLFDCLNVRQNGYISLGLPVSRKIIEDHGGQVRALLTEDQCLKFEVLLPVLTEEGGKCDE